MVSQESEQFLELIRLERAEQEAILVINEWRALIAAERPLRELRREREHLRQERLRLQEAEREVLRLREFIRQLKAALEEAKKL